MLFLNRFICLVLLFANSIVGMAQGRDWSPTLKGKVEKAAAVVYETEADKLTFEGIEIDVEVDGSTPSDLNGHLFKVVADKVFKGYIYVAQAPSMKNVFDYLVLFNEKLSVEKAKVLIYREQHGRQIGTARWLSQFKGMTSADRPELGKEIDGISGATISAKSMTASINKLLTSLSVVKEKGIL